MAFTVNFMKQAAGVSSLVKNGAQQAEDMKAAEEKGRVELEKLFPKTTTSRPQPQVVEVEISGKRYEVIGTPIYKTRNVKGGQDSYEYVGMRCEVRATADTNTSGSNIINTNGPTIESSPVPEGKKLDSWLRDNGN